MKRLGGMLAAAALVVVPAVAQAGFTMGGRLGLGVAFGELQGEVGGVPGTQEDLGDVVALEAPSINLHLGAAFAEDRVAVEGFFELSPLIITEEMNDWCRVNDANCKVLGTRFGVTGSFRFSPEGSLTPWVGAGLGYERLSIDQEVRSYVYTGISYELSGGLDFKADDGASWGPYASIQLGSFSDVEFDSDLYGSDSWGPRAGIHGWFQLGIRGRVDFGSPSRS